MCINFIWRISRISCGRVAAGIVGRGGRAAGFGKFGIEGRGGSCRRWRAARPVFMVEKPKAMNRAKAMQLKEAINS
ncbi:hypothetical protein Tsubulata_008584 [Turnera subulata]|uniref:Uncharacterized protein n=1 Tax=Turnera subulata TaxID=218843 RepID=A0A9Q0F7D2_9ROSI|nr:hypothetical protein Tsubulata_008584 [Turnera subulata]